MRMSDSVCMKWTARDVNLVVLRSIRIKRNRTFILGYWMVIQAMFQFTRAQANVLSWNTSQPFQTLFLKRHSSELVFDQPRQLYYSWSGQFFDPKSEIFTFCHFFGTFFDHQKHVYYSWSGQLFETKHELGTFDQIDISRSRLRKQGKCLSPRPGRWTSYIIHTSYTSRTKIFRVSTQ